jgi:hypothetical protein
MLMEPDCCKSDLSSRCSVCGRADELLELPGRTEKYCLGCSADLATATLLTAEIDAATLAGQNVTPSFLNSSNSAPEYLLVRNPRSSAVSRSFHKLREFRNSILAEMEFVLRRTSYHWLMSWCACAWIRETQR